MKGAHDSGSSKLLLHERLVLELEQKNVELAEASDRLMLQAKALDAAADAIIEHRHVQDELRESERRFQSMLSNLELIAITLDRDARINYCNDYLLRITGWTRAELLHRKFFEVFVPAEIFSEMQGTYAELLDDAPDAWHHENEILTRSGKRRLIQWNNSVLRSLSGEVIGVAASVRT